MENKTFSGIFPYLPTPVDENGHLKEKNLSLLVDHLVNRGIHGLTPLGSTGEGPYLDRDIKIRTVKTVVEAAAGRVPVIAGVNNMTTSGAIDEAVKIEALGVDGILVVLPDYFQVSDSEVVKHYKSVAEAVECPVTLYTNPKFTSWDFTIDALNELSKVPNIRYLKDASGNIGKIMSIVTSLNDRLKIFSASAHVPALVFMLGGVGWMAGPACLIPEKSIELYELSRQGRWEEALKLQRELWPLNQAFQKYSLAACVKAGLEMQGFDFGPPLLPQRQLDKGALEVVRGVLQKLGAL